MDQNIDWDFNLPSAFYEYDNSPAVKFAFDESIPQIISWGDGQFILTPQRRDGSGTYVFYFKLYETLTGRSLNVKRTNFLENKIWKFIFDKSSEKFIYVLVETDENVL